MFVFVKLATNCCENFESSNFEQLNVSMLYSMLEQV